MPTTDQTVQVPQAAISNFNNLPDDALMRVGKVSVLFDCSIPTIWRWTAAGKLPEPVRIGGVTGWQVGGLRKVLAGTR